MNDLYVVFLLLITSLTHTHTLNTHLTLNPIVTKLDIYKCNYLLITIVQCTCIGQYGTHTHTHWNHQEKNHFYLEFRLNNIYCRQRYEYTLSKCSTRKTLTHCEMSNLNRNSDFTKLLFSLDISDFFFCNNTIVVR